MLAGGTYNGELVLWDVTTTEADPQIAMSSIDDYFHREAIQSLQWVDNAINDKSGRSGAASYGYGSKVSAIAKNKELAGSSIATVSSDGKILIWDLIDDLRFPAKGFMLFAKKRLVGGRCLAFSPLERNLFVLGSETGSLIRGVCPPVTQGAA